MLLDEINMTQSAYIRYVEHAREMTKILHTKGLTPDDLSEEDAVLLNDGRIEIFVLAKGWKISFFLEPHEWHYQLKP